jgi:8-oxo-dGTP pyrophosphatase MutT (NUDIX family)
MRIEQLGPPGADHSTGLILRWQNRLLFAVLPAHLWQNTQRGTLAHFVGIGGHLEAGERWDEAVRREAREEAGVEIDLLSPAETWLLRDDGTVRDITAELAWPGAGAPRPLLIWSATLRVGDPAYAQPRHYVNAVFEAALGEDQAPYSAAEMQAILAITEAQLHQAACQPVPLGTLLSGGARIWTSAPIPHTTLMAPRGTAEWYDRWLQRRGVDKQINTD